MLWRRGIGGHGKDANEMADSVDPDQTALQWLSDLGLHCMPRPVCLSVWLCMIIMQFCFQPVFLTKEERAAQALKRRQEQVEEQKKKLEEERKKQMEFLNVGRDSMKGWFFGS